MKRTFDEINEKIKSGKAAVLTGQEAKELINQRGIKHFCENVDIVTFAAFELNVNALLYINFGQTDPLIYFSEAYINNVPVYPTGPTDLVVSCVASSKDNPEYSGANIVEDLVRNKDMFLKATGKAYDVFPNREFETWFSIKNLNHSRLLLNQAVNQNNIVAANSGNIDLNSHMGNLIAHLENSTFSSSSFLNPLVNDPFCRAIGAGTRVWVAGSEGLVIGHGSNHNPLQERNSFNIPVGSGTTLSVMADVNNMNSRWVRGGYLKSFGPVLFVGIGIPIPVLDEEIAECMSITDDKIHTTIVDFAIPRRTKPTFGQCTYKELRTSTVMINKKPTLSAPISSMSGAVEICTILKDLILAQKFLLSTFNFPIDLKMDIKKLDSRLAE